jgi:hypothetical protein
MSEDSMKMKSKLQDIIEEFRDETFDDCDETSPILVRHCDWPTQCAYIAERNHPRKEDTPIDFNHRP